MENTKMQHCEITCIPKIWNVPAQHSWTYILKMFYIFSSLYSISQSLSACITREYSGYSCVKKIKHQAEAGPFRIRKGLSFAYGGERAANGDENLSPPGTRAPAQPRKRLLMSGRVRVDGIIYHAVTARIGKNSMRFYTVDATSESSGPFPPRGQS